MGDKDKDESIPPLEMNISVLISLGYEKETSVDVDRIIITAHMVRGLTQSCRLKRHKPTNINRNC